MNAAQRRVLVRALFTFTWLCAVTALFALSDDDVLFFLQVGLMGFVAFATARYLRAGGKSE